MIHIYIHTHTHTLMSYIFYNSHVGVSVLRLVFVLESMIHSLSKAAINMVVKMEGLVPECEVDEPDNSMDAAAEVVEAMAVAESGRGWLWLPS